MLLSYRRFRLDRPFTTHHPVIKHITVAVSPIDFITTLTEYTFPIGDDSTVISYRLATIWRLLSWVIIPFSSRRFFFRRPLSVRNVWSYNIDRSGSTNIYRKTFLVNGGHQSSLRSK